MKALNGCEPEVGMKNWTSAARQKLEDYFGRVREDLRGSGADAEEVTEDLRRHIQQEVEALGLGIVTEGDVGRILARIGAPGEFVREAERVPMPKSEAPASAKEIPKPVKPPGWWWLVLGVALPLGTVIFEYLTGACAAALFDPLPNVVHVLLTLLVPAGNLWLWLALRGVVRVRPLAMGGVAGLGIGVSTVYALLFLPVSPLAVLGIVVYGLGLVPLAPYFALATGLVLQGKLARSLGLPRSPNLWLGMLAGITAFSLASAPLWVTRTGIEMVNSEEEATRERGVRLLRNWGLEEELLRACYGRMGRSGELYSWGKRLRPELARQVYYRAYGRAFNSVPPPKLYAGRASWNVMEQEFTWDFDQGGDQVAGRVKGLGLAASRQDVTVDPDAALAYLEWTLEFRNDSPLQREARAQVLLPEGAVVSRLTLWIEGEEREAAFGGRGQVKAAYKEVVSARRDPVLVTTCGPDRVLVQCFPVPPNGGLMKARLGITAPLALESPAEARLRLPCFLERNFSVRDSLRHSLWIDSPSELKTGSSQLSPEPGAEGRYTLRGALSETELAGAAGVVRVERDPGVERAWARDTRGESEGMVRQIIRSRPVVAPGRVILVIDGTRGMEAAYAGVAKALAALPAGLSFACILAADGAVDVSGGVRPADPKSVEECARQLRRASAGGGHDNTAALIRAWELAAKEPPGLILWLHGPQPEAFDDSWNLVHRFERGAGKVRLVSMQVIPGPNRILERLDGLADIRTQSLTGDIESDLRALLSRFAAGARELEIVRERADIREPGVGDGKETSLHLARLWAAAETVRLQQKRDLAGAMKLATRYQLVTPVSGAVVLETQQQYERAGLEPVPATSVPMIPEPSPAALLLVGCGLFWLHRWVIRNRPRWGSLWRGL